MGRDSFHRRYRINERIRAPRVRVVDPQGRQIGVMSRDNALRLAYDLGLDLVEVASQESPPVCRIMDFGKFKYQQKKRERSVRKKQKTQEVKEIKFRLTIDEHDFQRKLDNIKEFLSEGRKVRVVVFFRGREMQFLEKGKNLLNRVKLGVEKLGTVDKPPERQGRIMSMVIIPKGRSKSAETED